MTLNEIALKIAHTFNRHRDFFFVEKIKEDVVNIRAAFIRRDDGKYVTSNEFIQELGCVPVEQASATECCDKELGCDVLRTTMKVPKPLRRRSGLLFTYVGTKDRQNGFALTDINMVEFQMHNRFTGHLPMYAYHNEYIYIFQPPSKSMDYVRINGIFADPRDAEAFNECEAAGCYTDDDEFPIAEDMIEPIERMIMEKYGMQQPTNNEQVKVDEN